MRQDFHLPASAGPLRELGRVYCFGFGIERMVVVRGWHMRGYGRPCTIGRQHFYVLARTPLMQNNTEMPGT